MRTPSSPVPRSKRRGKVPARTLQVAAAGVLPARVPKRWVKFVVGLFLAPPALVLTQAFFTAFARATLHQAFWATEEFWFFALGGLLWLVAFFGLPRPVLLYVFGHELTHALCVMLMGGRVHRFTVTRSGGHVLASRTNTWIALAPYFIPIYSVLAIALYGMCGLFVDVSPFRPVLYAVLGATWSFHLSFTCWMLSKGQPDVHYGGTFFSLIIIYLLNLLLLVAMLILASRQLTWGGFGAELVHSASALAEAGGRIIDRLGRSLASRP